MRRMLRLCRQACTAPDTSRMSSKPAEKKVAAPLSLAGVDRIFGRSRTRGQAPLDASRPLRGADASAALSTVPPRALVHEPLRTASLPLAHHSSALDAQHSALDARSSALDARLFCAGRSPAFALRIAPAAMLFRGLLKPTGVRFVVFNALRILTLVRIASIAALTLQIGFLLVVASQIVELVANIRAFQDRDSSSTAPRTTTSRSTSTAAFTAGARLAAPLVRRADAAVACGYIAGSSVPDQCVVTSAPD